MKITYSLAQLQKEHVVLELECIDRMYLNAYVPQLTTERGIAAFCRGYLGHRFASTKQAVGIDRKMDALFRKWLARLPHPYSPQDRRAGYRYQLSILQTEFSLTQVWDQPVHGRCFFEEVIRENLDWGRPEQVQLIFGRKMQRKTATDGRCPTRIITQGVVPSLHVYYKNTHLKQYHKQQAQGAGLRTETTINNTYDFGVGRRLKNLAALRHIGMAINRRILEVEQVTHDCQIGAAAFRKLQQSAEVDGQHVSALPFGQARVQALLLGLVLFCLQPQGFRHRQLRPLLAQLLGLDGAQITPGQMS